MNYLSRKNRFFYWLNLYDSLLYNLFDDKIDKRLFSLSLQTYQYYKDFNACPPGLSFSIASNSGLNLSTFF